MQSSKPICEELKETITSSFRTIATSASSKEFIPKASVQGLLDQNVISKILQCHCQSCHHQRTSEGHCTVEEICDWIIRSSLQLFALLTYIGCPQLVVGFLAKDYNDGGIDRNLQNFTVEHVTKTMWPWFHAKDKGRSSYLAKQAVDHKYQFFVPTLEVCDASTIQTFDSEVIIPIVRHETVGYGFSGEVFGIKILDGYHTFPAGFSTPLVLKEVDLSRQSGESEELNILLQVQRLQDNNNPVHIVQLITAYQHGKKMNYIFPRVTTNLHLYFRDPKINHRLDLCRIEEHPLWRQTLGIFRALQLLHSDMYHTTSGKPIKVYHFDLKPANVLVDVLPGDMKLLLADFGFSRSRIATGRFISESRLTGHGGTAQYAPPEMMGLQNQRNHRYDVWSLGCILLEVCAFTVGGRQGVLDLDAVRYTDESTVDNEIWHDYFWRSSPLQRPELKPSVTKWMEKLPQASNVGSSNTSDFLKAVVGLALEMLNVDVNRRIDAETAQAKLNLILQRPTPGAFPVSVLVTGSSLRSDLPTGPFVRSVSSHASTESNPPIEISVRPKTSLKTSIQSDSTIMSTGMPTGSFDETISIGVDQLGSLGAVTCKYAGRFYDSVRLQFHEDDLAVLHLQLCSGSVMLQNIRLGSHDRVHVVTARKENVAPGLEVHLSAEDDPRLKVLNFYLPSSKDMAVLQSVLLGQSVRSFNTVKQRSLIITSLKIEQYRHSSRRMSSSSKSQVSSDDWGQPLRLELWSETSYHDMEALQRKMRRKTFRSLTLEVPPRRIVIFCQKALLLVKFAKSVRLAKPPGKYSGLTHKMVYTDQRNIPKEPSFAVAVLSADSSGSCKIPLDKVALNELHETSKFECTTLEFSFDNRQDWQAFMKKYKNMKDEWAKEDAELEEDLRYGGERRGWGISM